MSGAQTPKPCPKCGYTLASIEYAGVEVERCGSCYGIWFESGKPERLKGMPGSEAIDVGNTGLGKAYDDKPEVDCPSCKTRMVRMVDAKQPHIHYESCPSCYGMFFDAGEFRDFKREGTLLDFLRDLMARER